MYKFNNNKPKYLLFIFLLFLITNLSNSQEENYLESVIQRMNELELELKSIQTGSPNNLSNYDISAESDIIVKIFIELTFYF